MARFAKFWIVWTLGFAVWSSFWAIKMLTDQRWGFAALQLACIAIQVAVLRWWLGFLGRQRDLARRWVELQRRYP